MDLSKLLASAKNKRAEIESRKNNTTMKKIPGGKSRWRILPGWRPATPEVFYHEFGQHWIKDEDGKPLAIYVCDRVTFGKPCDICNIIGDAMRTTKDDKVLGMLKEMRGTGGTLVNVVQITGEGADPAKAGLLRLPNSVFEAYLSTLETYAESEVNLLDLKEGRDIIINKTGSGVMGTKYSIEVAPNTTKVNDSVMESLTNIDAWIEQQRAQGITKGVSPLNSRVASVLSLPAPSASKSLLGTGTKSISSSLKTTEIEDEIPFLTDGGAAKEVDDAEMKRLLASLED